MKIPETEQNTEEFQELIAMRTRSNTKRQSRSKEVNVYTRSPITVPAIKCNNITRTVLMSDQTTTSAPSSETCRDLYDQKQINGSKLAQIFHNKWTTTNQVHYYYGWLGVRCQSTTNLVLTEGEIFLYDGNGSVSDFETTENCITQDGKCITNNNIVLWDIQQITKKCRYRKVGNFDAQLYENHVIIDELQTSFVFSKDSKTFRSGNCNFSNPNLMDDDTVIDIVTRIANNRNRRNTNLALALPRGKLMMMETQRGDDSDPENTKFQYLFDSLQQEFQQQLKLVEQRTCENRNNLLLLIEWLSLIINRMVIAG
uniref:Uncharacterized protein n=1 Tax=Wuchereria bancrofti TaxID=6293 RepID=A0AAF5Q771_WUCBA